MKNTIWYNKNAGYNCVPDEDFEKYERIIGFNGEGNADVSLRIQGFASTNENISKRRYSFSCSVNLERGGRDWLETLDRMKQIIENEINYTRSRIGKEYITENERNSCF